MDKDTKHVLTVFTILGAFAAGYFISGFEHRDEIETGRKLWGFAEIRNEMGGDRYYDNSNEEYAAGEAVKSYYRALGDRYFRYDNGISPEDCADKVNKSNMAVDNGFTVEANEDGNLRVTEVKEGSYAQQQGLCKADVIYKVNDKLFAEVGLKDGVHELLGKSGTECDIYIRRGSREIALHYVRKHEKQEAVENFRFEQIEDICYVKLDSFSGGMEGFKTLDELMDGDCRGYIIDLRGNLGGETELCMHALGSFIGEQKVGCEYYTSGRTNEMRSVGNKIYNKPVVILINGDTASAAEIFTGAMKLNYKDTTLVGETTFGKGVFQIEKRTDSDAVLRYTAGCFTVGDLPCWQGYGITPDIMVDMDDELDVDVQLQTAIDLLKE